MNDREILELILKKVDNIDTRLDSIEKRLDNVEKRLDSVEIRLDNIEKRLQVVENDLSILKNDVEFLKTDSKEINRKMNAVYEQVANLLEFQTEMRMFKKEIFEKTDQIVKTQEVYRDWMSQHEVDIRLLKRVY